MWIAVIIVGLGVSFVYQLMIRDIDKNNGFKRCTVVANFENKYELQLRELDSERVFDVPVSRTVLNGAYVGQCVTIYLVDGEFGGLIVPSCNVSDGELQELIDRQRGLR